MPSPPAAKDAASHPPVTSAVPESSSGLDDAPPDPPGPVPRPSPRRRLDVANGVFPEEATPDDDDATDVRSETAGSDPPGSEKQHSFRERLWEYLLGNMVRAVDEAYFLCELECGAAEIDAAANLLAASSNDFRELAATLRDQEAYAASPGGARSISWDVGRTTARPSEDARAMISAIVGPPRVGPGPDDGAPGAPSTSRSPDRSKKKKSPIAAATTNDDARGGEWQTAGPKGGKGRSGSGQTTPSRSERRSAARARRRDAKALAATKHRSPGSESSKGNHSRSAEGHSAFIRVDPRGAPPPLASSFRRSFTDPSADLAAAALAASRRVGAAPAPLPPPRGAGGLGRPPRPPEARSSARALESAASLSDKLRVATPRAGPAPGPGPGPGPGANAAAMPAGASGLSGSAGGSPMSASSARVGSESSFSWADSAEEEDDPFGSATHGGGGSSDPGTGSDGGMIDEKEKPGGGDGDGAGAESPNTGGGAAAAWGERRDWGAILGPAESSRSSLAARLMRGPLADPHPTHAKLMSPERKKKTSEETAAALRERHERAREARLRAEVERQEKRRLDETRASALSEEARRLASERRSRAEARHRRAEETREARVAEIVAKASEETRKVEEIAFYNSLETENKKAALRERLAEAERRRAAAAEAKEAAAKAAAEAARKAEERRASDEQLKRQTLEDRVREKELRREKERREREATRAEQERRRLEEAESKSQRRIEKALDAKASEDARRDELRARLLAADSRRREYLTAVRERAVGKEERAGAGGGGAQAGGGPGAGPASPGRSGGTTPGRWRPDAAGDNSPGCAGNRQSPGGGVEKAGLESSLETSRVAAAADRHRAMRKRAKKLRQRLAAAARTEQGSQQKTYASDVPEHAEAAKPRLTRVAVAVARRKPDALAQAHRETTVALAEAGAAAAAASESSSRDDGGAKEKNPRASPAEEDRESRRESTATAPETTKSTRAAAFDASPSGLARRAARCARAAAVTSGLVRSLAEALGECLESSAKGIGGFAASPAAASQCVALARALDAATAGSPLAAEALLLENLATPLVPHLVAGLGLVGDPVAAEAATPGVGGGLPPPTAALEPLLAVVTRVIERGVEPTRSSPTGDSSGNKTGGTGDDSPFAPLLGASLGTWCDFCELVVVSGAVDALASLFALFDRPKEQSRSPVPPAILAGLRMLEALLAAASPPAGAEARTATEPAPARSPLAASLIGALGATALGGLPSLITSVLLQTESELRAPVLADARVSAAALPPNFLPVALCVMRLLNATARFGPEAAQDALGGADLRHETHHILSFAIAMCCSTWDDCHDAKTEGDAETGKDSSGLTRGGVQALLDETVLFVGAFASMRPENQDMLCWGRAPTLAQRLPDLPFEYYSDPARVAALFPTLVAVAFNHPTNRAIIENELSLETLRAFVSEERKARAENEPSAAAKRGLPPQFDLAARVPPSQWAEAEAYFENATTRTV